MAGFASFSVGLSCRVVSVFHIYLCVCEPVCLYFCIGKKRRRRRNGAVLCGFMLVLCNFQDTDIVRRKYHCTGNDSFPRFLKFVMAGGCCSRSVPGTASSRLFIAFLLGLGRRNPYVHRLSAPFLLPLTPLIQRGEKGGPQLEGRPHSSPPWQRSKQELVVAATRSAGRLGCPLLNRSDPVLLLASTSSIVTRWQRTRGTNCP